MHLIGDELTVTGMRLGGLKNVHIATEETVGEVLKKVSEKARITVITRNLAIFAKKDIEKLRKLDKIIVEVPDRSGGGEDFVDQLVKDVIGFELKR
jgi:vacuolar-type H+-ATPase subunit F/Vma7